MIVLNLQMGKNPLLLGLGSVQVLPSLRVRVWFSFSVLSSVRFYVRRFDGFYFSSLTGIGASVEDFSLFG